MPDPADLASALYDPETHRETLHLLAELELTRRDYRAAFLHADRLCRISGESDARSLLLRSRSARQLGDAGLARDDLAKAFALDPIDPAILCAILEEAAPGSSADLLRLVFENPYADSSVQGAAFDAAERDGYHAVTRLTASPERLHGWIAWRGRVAASLRLNDRSTPTDVPLLDAIEPAAERGWTVAKIEIALDIDSKPARTLLDSLQIAVDGCLVKRLSVDKILASARMRPTSPQGGSGSDADSVSVVVPLYGDRRMTQLCLLGLAQQRIPGTSLRVLLVQDNPRSRRMSALAERAAQRFGFEVLTNTETIGYAASVNRALARINSGDVVLLNADAVLPPRALQRLKAAAERTPDIATVTPLSNNGEETSFPSPFHATVMGSCRQIRALDAIAEKVNNGHTVTLVNGVGYCLYVTRRALNIVPELPEHYERGYYEDVDFCLAAKAAGLRNVCATNVFVGHKGASSFKGDKRALVVRNRLILERRYPTYAADSLALLRADPLRKARARIEAASKPASFGSALLIVPPHLSLLARARLLEDHSRTKLVLSWTQGAPDDLEVRATDGEQPQSLSFLVPHQLDGLVTYLIGAGVQRVYLAGPCLDLTALVDRLKRAGPSIEIVSEDSPSRMATHERTGCNVAAGTGACEPCAEWHGTLTQLEENRIRGVSLETSLEQAGRVEPANAMAKAVAQHHDLSNALLMGAEPSTAAAPKTAGRTLGILGDALSASEMRLLLRLMSDPESESIVLFGSTLDDLRVMSCGKGFVTGPLQACELETLFRFHDVGALFAPGRGAGFGELQKHGGDRPKAYFGWANGSTTRRSRDLALDPRICDAKAVHCLKEWWFSLRSTNGAA